MDRGDKNNRTMIVQETHLVEYKGRIIPLYQGESRYPGERGFFVNKWYAQFGNVSEYDGTQIVEFEEIDKETAMELIKNSSI